MIAYARTNSWNSKPQATQVITPTQRIRISPKIPFTRVSRDDRNKRKKTTSCVMAWKRVFFKIRRTLLFRNESFRQSVDRKRTNDLCKFPVNQPSTSDDETVSHTRGTEFSGEQIERN